jgi:hypothetical protein
LGIGKNFDKLLPVAQVLQRFVGTGLHGGAAGFMQGQQPA